MVKKSDFLKRLYRKYNKCFFRIVIKKSPIAASKYFYRKIIVERLILKKQQHPLLSVCADKYKVRKYVIENGYGEILNDLYGVFERADEINFNNSQRNLH